MLGKPSKRIKNKRVQRIYYDEHEYDEYELWVNNRRIPRDQVHEIVFGSRKTYEYWNMISLTYSNHERAHGKGNGEPITARDLFIAKILSGVSLPNDIVREFDLQEYV